MPKNPLFSTYRQGENRVTSSMLAVFERIDLGLLETILAAAAGESALQMVTFTNQPPGAAASVPDARISARFSYWFEVKTVRSTLRRNQLVEHLACLADDGDERLFVVTPDGAQPALMAELDDPRVVWFNFQALSDAIEGALADETGLVSEQARFLLRELQALLVEEGLLDTDDVAVVAARIAYGEYLDHGVYVCQPGRAFRGGLTHLGFYFEGAIQREIPRIMHREDNVVFTPAEAAQRRGTGDPFDARVARAIEGLLAGSTRQDGHAYQVFVLAEPDAEETVTLEAPVANDTKASSGRPFAWTMGQRYVSLARLTAPGVTVTSDLEPQ